MDFPDEPTPPSPETEAAGAPRRRANLAMGCGLAGVVLPIVGLVPALVAAWCGWRALRATSAEARRAGAATPTLFDVLAPEEDRWGAYLSRPRGRALVGFALGLGGLGIQGAVLYLAARYWI